MAIPPTSLRKVRHDVRNGLMQTLDALFRPSQVLISDLGDQLRGEEGLSPAEQAERLNAAAEIVTDLAAVIAAMDVAAAAGNLEELAKQLNDAAEFAQTRDFDAHQQAKRDAGDGAVPALDGDGFVTPDEQIGDQLAAELNPTTND